MDILDLPFFQPLAVQLEMHIAFRGEYHGSNPTTCVLRSGFVWECIYMKNQGMSKICATLAVKPNYLAE